MKGGTVLLAFAITLLPSMMWAASDAKQPLAWLGMGVRPYRDKADHRVLHVERTTPGGPADRAGLRPGDLITELGGAALQIGDDLDFLMFLAEHKPGDRLHVTLVRSGAAVKVVVTFGVMPESARARWNYGLEMARRARAATRRAH